MKNTKKLMAILLSLVMMMSLFAVNTSAITYNNAEYKWDFQNLEIGTGSAMQPYQAAYSLPVANNQVIEFLCGDWGGLTVFVEEDPAGVAGNHVMRYTREHTTNTLTGHTYHAYTKDMKTAFSFKFYAPETGAMPIKIMWRYNNDSTDATIAEFTDSVMNVFGNQLKHKNGNNVTYVKGVWTSCTIVIDDTTDDGLFAEAYINGEKVLERTRVMDNPTTQSWKDYIHFRGGAGTVYYDDIESRRATEWGTLVNAPVATLDAKHQGEAVLVSDKEIDLTFTAGTDNLMDTSTYKNNITVKAGAVALTEGTDYTVSYNDLKNVKLTFAKNLNYNTTYTVAVSDAVKNVAGVSAPATLTFKTEKRAGNENADPEVTFAGIKDKTRYNVGEAINFSVNVSDLDGDAISSVKIYADGKEVASDNAYPYEFSLNSLSEGTHSLVAVATDERDAQGTSGALTVIVKANTATIIRANIKDGFKFIQKGSISIVSDSYDPDGEAIGQAEISVDNGAAQYGTYTGDVSIGTHTANIKVTDSRGNVYTKAIEFEYFPEYRLDNFTTLTNFDDVDITVSNTGSFIASKENVVESRGNSLAISSGSDAGAGAYYTLKEDWQLGGTAALRTDKVSYEFMAEDVNAQIIRFPGSAGGYDNMNYMMRVKIINGVITDINTGKTYGTIESGRWYKVEMFISGPGQEVTVNVGENQFTLKYSQGERETAEGTAAIHYQIRAIRYDLYEAIAGGSNGKKVYFDNFGNTRWGRKYADIYGVYAVDSNGTVSKADIITDDTQYFIMELESGWPTITALNSSHVSVLKNGTDIGCTAEYYGTKFTRDGRDYYTKLKITPSEKVVAGEKYTITLNAGSWSYPLNDTLYSDSHLESPVTYGVEKAVYGKKVTTEGTALYDGSNKVEKIANIAGDSVSYGVNVINLSGAEKTVYAVAVAYKGNRITDVQFETVPVANDTKTEIKTPAVKKADATLIKGMILDLNYAPLADAVIAD